MSHIIQYDSDLAGRQTRDNNRDQLSLSLSLSLTWVSRLGNEEWQKNNNSSTLISNKNKMRIFNESEQFKANS